MYGTASALRRRNRLSRNASSSNATPTAPISVASGLALMGRSPAKASGSGAPLGTGARAGPLRDGDVGVHGYAGDHLADDLERQVVGGLEADAGLAHVESLAGLLEAVAEPPGPLRVAVRGHKVERRVVLVGHDARVAERVAIVGGRVRAQRHFVADHAAAHRFLVAARQVLPHHVAHGG